MVKIFEMTLRNAKHEPCDDLDLGFFVNVRTATLMKQIIASTFFRESRYNVQRIRELLNGIGGRDFNPEQTQLFSTLENILRDVENKNPPSAVKTMAKNAEKEIQSINKFCWRSHSELIKGFQGVMNSVRCKEEGWNPEEVMNALVVALVREIISLFGLSLDTLISFARKVCSDAFDGVTTKALERIVTLYSLVMSAEAFLETERNKYVKKYEVVVKAFDFQRHFTFQPDKRRESYVRNLLVDEVPLEICHSYSKRSSHDECEKEKEKLRQKNTKSERKIQTLSLEHDNSQDRLQQAEASNRNLAKQLDEQREKMDELREKLARAELKERITCWENEHEKLQLQKFLELANESTAEAQVINRAIRRQSEMADELDVMEYNLTLTASLIENLGAISGNRQQRQRLWPFEDE